MTEHLTVRWKPLLDDGAWHVVTEDEHPWWVADMPHGLPGDKDGGLTARVICDQHNAAICSGDLDHRAKLWAAINEYAASCHGDPSKYVYGNTRRQKAVVDVEAIACTPNIPAETRASRSLQPIVRKGES